MKRQEELLKSLIGQSAVNIQSQGSVEKDPEMRLGLSNVYALSKDIVFLFGDLEPTIGGFRRSVLLRSDDGGKHWKEVMTPVRGSSVLSIMFVDKDQGWALVGWTYGDLGDLQLYHSTDYGQTWQKVSDVPKRAWYGLPSNMQFFDGKTGRIEILYVGGAPRTDGYSTLTTSDGGQTWQETSKKPYALDERGKPIIAVPRSPDEVTGRDGSLWQLQRQYDRDRTVISRRLPSEPTWTVVGIIPTRLKCSDGRVIIP